jgi:histidyl-tRNA synthetase
LWKRLGLEGIELEINTLGNVEERKAHRQELIAYFSDHEAVLDEDSKRRLHSNPLRILDTKNPDMQALVEQAPKLMEHLSDESKQHFENLCELLKAAGVSYTVNTRLVRGLDYYTHTVFEWVTDRLGAQGTVCAGGRYDGLVEQLGGRSTPAAGFAMGVERLVALLEESGHNPAANAPDAYLVAVGDDAREHGLLLAERLRDSSAGLKVQFNCGGGSFKSQMKRADRSGARFAIILGTDEIENNTVGIKDLRETGEQVSISQAELAGWLQDQADNNSMNSL